LKIILKIFGYIRNYFYLCFKTGDDDEEGKSIATIDDLGNIYYIDKRAVIDEAAQELIQEVKQQKINAKLVELAKIKKDYSGFSESYSMDFQYPIDELLGFLTKAKKEGHTHIYPRWTHSGSDKFSIQVVTHRQETIEETLERVKKKQKNNLHNLKHHEKVVRTHKEMIKKHLNL